MEEQMKRRRSKGRSPQVLIKSIWAQPPHHETAGDFPGFSRLCYPNDVVARFGRFCATMIPRSVLRAAEVAPKLLAYHC